MKLFKVGAFLVLAAAAAACQHDTTGTAVTQDSLAGLRYMNLVADTGAVDFRIVDVVSWAPNQTAATFRTGGFVDGISLGGNNPVYMPVAAGSRHIRVFLNGSTPSVSSIILLDTNVTFVSSTNYTFYLFGYAHSPTNGTPALNARIVQDTTPAFPASNFAIRVIHLAPTLAPTLATTAVDVFVDTLAVGATPVGAPTYSNVNFGDVRAYTFKLARPAAAGPPAVPALSYRVAIAATGTTTPFFAVALPNGVAGNSTTQPVPGSQVLKTGMSFVLVPRSVAGTAATSFATPSGLVMVDQLPDRTAP